MSRSPCPRGPGTSTRSRSTPLLVQIGRQYHPAHPYQSPRVTVHVADGRQYLQDTQQHYNLILYALPDSLTALAGQSAIRLESYLLTSRGARGSPGAPGTRWHVRDVQLLRAVRAQQVRDDDRGRISPGSRARSWAGCQRPADGRPDRPARRARCRTAPASGTAPGWPRPPTTARSPTCPARPSRATTCGCWARSCSPRCCLSGSAAARSPGCGPISTSRSWAPPSCCWKPRASCSSRCCSAPPGS